MKITTGKASEFQLTVLLTISTYTFSVIHFQQHYLHISNLFLLATINNTYGTGIRNMLECEWKKADCIDSNKSNKQSQNTVVHKLPSYKAILQYSHALSSFTTLFQMYMTSTKHIFWDCQSITLNKRTVSGYQCSSGFFLISLEFGHVLYGNRTP